MPESPTKPKSGSEDLHEVERALSVLGGRHPEHERARREDEENVRRRAAQQDLVARSESKRISARRAILIGLVPPILGLFVFIAIFGRREMARRARIDAVSASFNAYGFVPIETSLRGSTGAVEATGDPGCFLAVSTSTAPITISRAGATTTATGPALFCTCVAERIGLSSSVGGQGGVALLRADTSMIGGSRAFPFLPFGAATKLAIDGPCAESSLDGWIDAKHAPQAPASDHWLGEPAHASLKGAGFHVLAHAEGTLPFAVADVPADSCIVARSALASDALSIRVKGEKLPLLEGPASIAYCRKAPATIVVSHLGTGDLFVLAAPAAKVGGLLGLRESANASGLAIQLSSVAPGDRGWDAEQALVASAIPATAVTTFTGSDIPPDPDARVVAVSLEQGNELFYELAPNVRGTCAPAIEPARQQREELCVFSGIQKWKMPPANESVAFGLSRSKLPSWLFSMQAMTQPVALAGMAKVLRVARELARQGFVPTTLEALIERPNGVEVLGRTGEDAVVAVGVAPAEPFVYPLSEDAAWDLDGAPQIALVKPLEKVTLVTSIKHLPPIALRRTVVFRRQAQVIP